MIDILMFGFYITYISISIIIFLSGIVIFPSLKNIGYKYQNTIRWTHLISVIGLVIGLIIIRIFEV